MNSQIHLLIVRTLSMIITFVLYYSLKDTIVVNSYFQRTLIDRTRDSILFVRCLLNSEKINETCNVSSFDDKSKRNFSIKICFLTITTLYVFVGFCNGFHIWYEFDIFSVYFFIWQFTSLVIKWEMKYFPEFSLNIYQGWLCMTTAFEAFFFYDAVFRYFTLWINFSYIWISSVEDIIACLHVKGRLYKRKSIKKISKGIQSVPCGFYNTWDVDDSQSNTRGNRSSLDLGDFVMFNFMLLLILNPLSSIATNICITIGQEVTHRLGILYNQYSQPALPLSVITFSTYAILLYVFVEY